MTQTTQRTRSKTAIALRELGKKPKEVVEFMRSREFPESKQAFATFARIPASDARNAYEKAEVVLDECDALGIAVIVIGDPFYPKRLERLQNGAQFALGGFCPILYCKGNPAGLNAENAMAVVGTRTPTAHGFKMARRIGKTLAEKEFAVVSGLALGCDTEGHLGCLEGNGVGVAVLAHGLDHVYPKANIKLAEDLIDGGGCLVSEYRPGVPPAKYQFASRDRIQSGLSDAVVVVETPATDGTMHTADFAKKQGRALWVVAPQGNKHETSGNYLLLERGASKLTDPEQAIRFSPTPRHGGQGLMVQETLP